MPPAAEIAFQGDDNSHWKLLLDYEGGKKGERLQVVGFEHEYQAHSRDCAVGGVILPRALLDYFPPDDYDYPRVPYDGNGDALGLFNISAGSCKFAFHAMAQNQLLKLLRDCFDEHGCGDGQVEHRILFEYGLRSPPALGVFLERAGL